MTVSLRVLVETFGLVPLAAPDALDCSVRWVHVSELPDPAVYLEGGELLLRVGVQLSSASSATEEYVQRLVRGGIAGLGFGTGPVHASVPDALVRACQDAGLPLLEVPDRVPFLALSKAVSEAAAAAESARLRQLAQGSRTLARAAVGPAGVRAVLARLAESLGGWVVLTSPDGRPNRVAGGPVQIGPDVQALVKRIAGGSQTTSAALQDGDTHVELQGVGWLPDERSVLVVGKPAVFDATDRGLVNVAVALLMLLTEETFPSHDPPLARAFVAVACGGAPEDAEAVAAAACGSEPGGDWRVLACRRATGTGGERTTDDPVTSLRALLRTPLAAAWKEHIVALRPESQGLDDLPSMTDALSHAGWVVGISEARPWSTLPASAAEAETTLIAAMRLGHAVIAGQPIVGGLPDLVAADAARSYASALFAPLAASRSPGPDELLRTLHVWLAAHGSWDRAATELGVHRNTVRHRIGQVERLLTRDLTAADARMELWFALSWLAGPSRPPPE